MKVSIITSAYNNVLTLEDSIKSILGQSYDDIEHIIIDGGSTDGTTSVIEKYSDSIAHWVSEPDKGIYYALNKGIECSTGDIIGFLHADDYYANDEVIENVVSKMIEHNVDGCYGDLQYISRDNTEKIIRHWKASPYKDGCFHKGWMLPHPTFFVKKEIYNKYGKFNTDYRIAADYELMLRFIEKNRISIHYIPEVLVKMRVGGLSNKNLSSILQKTSEDLRVCKENNLNNALCVVFLKNISKVSQFFRK